jgi:hypothetical protein
MSHAPAALRDFNPAYDRFGSVASDRHARDVAARSASHPITTELVRHNEPALRANNGQSADPDADVCIAPFPVP